MSAASAIDVQTAAFGQIETVAVPEDSIWTFPGGLPGFEGYTRFALVDDERIEPFHWLQSLDDVHTGFVVIEPAAFTTDYAFDLSDDDVALLGFDGATEPRVLCILVVTDDVRSTTANLRAPIVVNPARRLAKQVILTDERLPIRQPIFQEATDSDERRTTC